MRIGTRFQIAALLAAIAGWLSLSQEILWVRIIAGAWRNSPLAFGTTLGSFLVGIAIGALLSPVLQRRLGWSSLAYCATCLGTAGALFWLLPGIGSVIDLLSRGAGLVSLHVATALVAVLMGGLLPALARYGVAEDEMVGARVGVVYFANVIGSTIGPLFTGFVLLEWVSVETAVLIIAIAGMLTSATIVWMLRGPARAPWIGVAVAALALMIVGHATLYDGFAERLHFRTGVREMRYVYQSSGRVGSVGIRADGQLFGEGLYDGGYNVDPAVNSNGILRAYLLPVLHANPRKVLQIGLGSGSWTSVIASYPDVESLTVVEINPRYVDALRQYPAIAGSLGPKVRIDIDDGRHWLRRHPSERFDAIVMNASWHWRSSATHLLSLEFMRELRDHLEPAGVLYFNTTSSRDAMRTAAAVFAHVVQHENFAAGSDRPFAMPMDVRLQRLRRFPAFLDPASAEGLQSLLVERLTDIGPDLRASNSLWTVTQDNMATEFKTNWSGQWWRELPARAFVPERGWLHVLYP